MLLEYAAAMNIIIRLQVSACNVNLAQYPYIYQTSNATAVIYNYQIMFRFIIHFNLCAPT